MGARSGCWEFDGCLVQGYGHAWLDGKQVKVHRAAYEALVGPIPEGLVIDHLCRNTACYNPAHLEPVTNAENIRRGVPHRRTFRPEYPVGDAVHDWCGQSSGYMRHRRRGEKPCAECRVAWRDRQREYRARKDAK